jgi:hypothetical protein
MYGGGFEGGSIIPYSLYFDPFIPYSLYFDPFIPYPYNFDPFIPNPYILNPFIPNPYIFLISYHSQIIYYIYITFSFIPLHIL